MPPHEYLAAASIAYAIAHIGSLEPLRALASAWSLTGKLTTCSFCLGFWASLAVRAAGVYPCRMAAAGLGGALFGAFLAVVALRWGRRVLVPGAMLGALLAVLVAGVALPLLDGATPAGLVLDGLVGALVALACSTAIQAGMAYVVRTSLDDF